jgi:hypothetical protein
LVKELRYKIFLFWLKAGVLKDARGCKKGTGRGTANEGKAPTKAKQNNHVNVLKTFVNLMVTHPSFSL